MRASCAEGLVDVCLSGSGTDTRFACVLTRGFRVQPIQAVMGPKSMGTSSPLTIVCVCVWCVVVQLEVFPDEEVRVVNANQVPDDDYASVFDGVAGALLYVC